MSKPQTGAEQIINQLVDNGVVHVFGYSGGAALPLFDALSLHDDIEIIVPRHEQGASHMADGYARVSGKLGVGVVTSGPGVTNTFTGVMTANMDNVPLMIVSGQVPTHALGTDAFQEVAAVQMAQHITKKSVLATKNDDVRELTSSLMHEATSGRPGAVLLDVPKDLSASVGSSSTAEFALTTDAKPGVVNTSKIKIIMDAWAKAKRPVILAGHGVLIAKASDQLFKLANLTNTPVTTTLLGKGAFPETHSLSLGMLGMHGTVYANKAILDADFILNIGSRFDDRIVGAPSEFGKNAFKVHVDIDEAEINKIIAVNIGVVSDAQVALGCMILHAKVAAKPHAAWLKTIQKNKADYPLAYERGAGLTMQEVIEQVYEQTAGDAIATTDVGQHQMWAAHFWKVDKPDTWVTSGGAGTMGYGMPAAIGAKIAQPEREVVAFVGDGGYQMTMAEVMTAVRYKVPIKVFVLDNEYLGMVRQWQELFHENRESGVDMSDNPNFAEIAKLQGAEGIYIDSRDDLASGVKRALAVKDKPVIVHVKVEKTDNVYPFIPAGAPYTDMHIYAPETPLASPTGST